MGSETLPSACYILSDESSIPFYSTSNGYKNIQKLLLLWTAVHVVASAQESVRRQLLYIAAKLKICHYGPIVTSNTPIERYRTN